MTIKREKSPPTWLIRKEGEHVYAHFSSPELLLTPSEAEAIARELAVAALDLK